MSGSVELVLVRHGESEGNNARERAELAEADVIEVKHRDADVVLSDLGLQQAKALGQVLQREQFDQVWSSPYLRARDTARIALGADRAPRLDERLRDRELGVLDRLTTRGVAARFPDEAERRRWLGKLYYRPPGGESWADVTMRLRSWMSDAIAAGRILVVTHDAVILLFRYLCEELDETSLLELAASASLGNASITRLLREGPTGPWAVESFDYRDHLGDLSTDHPAEKQHVHPS
jgi:broad specificity phosphatase PhoE